MVVHLLCAMLLLIGVSFFYLTESKFRIFISMVILAAIIASYCGLYPENIAALILILCCYTILFIMLGFNARRFIVYRREFAARQNGSGKTDNK